MAGFDPVSYSCRYAMTCRKCPIYKAFAPIAETAQEVGRLLSCTLPPWRCARDRPGFSASLSPSSLSAQACLPVAYRQNADSRNAPKGPDTYSLVRNDQRYATLFTVQKPATVGVIRNLPSSDQLPDLSTIIRVEPSATDTSRLQGALPFSGLMQRSKRCRQQDGSRAMATSR
jgi:hypothetical protein